jgi:hypothetical protein
MKVIRQDGHKIACGLCGREDDFQEVFEKEGPQVLCGFQSCPECHIVSAFNLHESHKDNL